VRKKTFEIVYWSQNVVVNNCKGFLLEYNYKWTIIHQIVMQVSDYIYLRYPSRIRKNK